jgi:hypothetical protein
MARLSAKTGGPPSPAPMMRAVIPCAYLRVFRPLETFPDDERSEWERYIVAGGRAAPIRPVYRQEAQFGDGRLGLIASDDGGERADIRLVEGRYFVCPWRTRLRVLASILSLRESAPFEMADAFVPDAEARRAARELARLKRREPSAVPAMLQSPWHVPIRWFVLVDEDERHLVETEGGEYRLYYWTPISVARRRAERALQLVRRSELAPVAELVKELVQWLSSFHLESMVELDYAEVSSLFTWDELDNDHSGREIQEAIEAVRQVRGMSRAVDLYQAVAARWAEARSRESLN